MTKKIDTNGAVVVGGGGGPAVRKELAEIKALLSTVSISKRFFDGQRSAEIDEGLPSIQMMPSVTRQRVPELIEAPVDFERLSALIENSSAVRQCLDAMATSCASFGWELVPTIDLEKDNVTEKVIEILKCQNLRRLRAEGREVREIEDSEIMPSTEDVTATVRQWKLEALLEKGELECFLRNVNPTESFVQLKVQSILSREGLGNAAWEVNRDRMGRIARIDLVPWVGMSITLRGDHIDVEMRRKVDEVTFETVTVKRAFRAFAQMPGKGRPPVWFKEFGDPRTLSARTGAYYASTDELEAEEGEEAIAASEIIHDLVEWPFVSLVHGLPRWIGTSRGIMGVIDSEEVNMNYFRSKGVPLGILAVSDGRFKEGAVASLEKQIEEKVVGKDKFWAVLTIEAETPANASKELYTGRPKIEYIKLSSEQLKDGVFAQFEDRSIDKVGESMRLPPMLRGKVKDVNRANAEASERFAERYVFRPERNNDDELFQRTVLSDMGIRFWKLNSLGPTLRDTSSLPAATKSFIDADVIDPNEARTVASQVLGIELKSRDKDEDGAGLQDRALNGAQVKAMQEIITAAAMGAIPMPAAKMMIRIAFPTIQPEDVEEMIASLEGFVPSPDLSSPGKAFDKLLETRAELSELDADAGLDEDDED